MLERTFIHIQGIGPKTERRLWERGIRTWRDFLAYGNPVFSRGRDEMVRKEIETSLKCRNDIRFFRDRLVSGEMWRTFGAFRGKSAYLDIETNGGYQGIEEITVIGVYDGVRVQTFVNGINLDEFEIAIAEYEVVITFSGSTFDLPVIRRFFPNISLPPAHIDLRFLWKRLGYRGGLKRIEKELNVGRDKDIDGMDGYDAVLLWQDYQWGNQAALERLIQYNTADIVNLEPLMKMGYQEMKMRLLSSLD